MSCDGLVRITLDHGLSFFDQRFAFMQNIMNSVGANSIIILGAKFNIAETDKAIEMLSSLRFRNSRISKYVRGVKSFCSY